MARTLSETAVTTRNARKALKPGLYWRGIEPDVHLGYRRGKRAGVWLVRWRSGAGYRQAPIGVADDVISQGNLDFETAHRKAREHVAQARIEAEALATGPAITVRTTVDEYLAARDARETKRAGRPKRSDASQRMGRYVIGQEARGKQEAITPAEIADKALVTLTEEDLIGWTEGLPDTMKRSTRQRLVNDLKAALNGAYARHRQRLAPAVLAAIKNGLRAPDLSDDAKPVARENQILSDAEVARILRAARIVDEAQEWEGDLFRLIVVLAATGARFSQVARLTVGDCQVSNARLMMPASRKGRGKSGQYAVPIGRDVLDALAPIVAGRAPTAPLLERWRREQKAGSIEWHRTERGPWQASAEFQRAWQEVRKLAELPAVIPYALRHSSIVRGIRGNLPIRLVAALHDTSVLMIEKHYSRWITDGLEDLARGAIVPLVPTPDVSNVARLRRAG